MFSTREIGGQLVADVRGDEILIRGEQDLLDLMGSLGWPAPRRWILHEGALDPSFFDLATGLAGVVTQKLTNYGIRVAIVGDFERHAGRSLQAYIRECNRGGEIVFVKTVQDAEGVLSAE